jgi:hypothetical protein
MFSAKDDAHDLLIMSKGGEIVDDSFCRRASALRQGLRALIHGCNYSLYRNWSDRGENTVKFVDKCVKLFPAAVVFFFYTIQISSTVSGRK